MLKIIRLLVFIIMVVLSTSCATTQPIGSESVAYKYIDGIVQSRAGNQIVAVLKLPDITETQGTIINDMAQQVAIKCILVDGVKTEVNGNPMLIKEIQGKTAVLVPEASSDYPVGAKLRLKIPKKIVAIVDFEVIKGANKEAGRITMEDLSSALINSGQFVVVERTKMRSVMNELQLIASGLTREKPDSVIGQLFAADLILTGTFAEIKGGEWAVNLKLINVHTGQVIAAIPMHTRLFDLKEIRDTSLLDEDFEGSVMSTSWYLRNSKEGVGPNSAVVEVKHDLKTGAAGSKHSARIDFRLPEGINQTMATLNNQKKRDVSFYNGIEFYVKATEPLIGQFDMLTSLPSDSNSMDRWYGSFKIDRSWKKVRMPFAEMVIARGWIKEGHKNQGAKLGDQILRLDRIENLRIGINSKSNRASSGTIWIDKIKFYVD